MLNIHILYSSISGGVLCGIQAIPDTRTHRNKPLPAVNSEANDDFWVKGEGQHIHAEIMPVPTVPKCYGKYTNL